MYIDGKRCQNAKQELANNIIINKKAKQINNKGAIDSRKQPHSFLTLTSCYSFSLTYFLSPSLAPPQVAMVEVQLDHETAVPPGMLVAFAICTTLLVAVHMLALMISTCILPNVETVCNLHSISLVHESPHERLHWYIETAWAFSTLLGLILFLVEIAILCWVKFYDLSHTAAWSAVVVLIPVMIIFLAFAVHFYRSLVTHKYEVTVSGIRELEMLKEQMEQDHLEIHNNSRNNGFNYGASGDIV